ncbi:MAG TPA: DUF5615 family PIN-like protein [Thermomicrobiales bacterium]|jgi:hypothetical protein
MAIAGLSALLHFDHNVDPQFAEDLRRHDYDVTVAKDLGMERASDEEHLIWATDHGRVVFTYDAGDYRRIAARWFLEGRTHAGIIISVAPPRIGYGVVLRRLLALLEYMSADDLVDRVVWLDDSFTRHG